MQLDIFLNSVNNILPPCAAIDGDRIGLQIHSGNDSVHSILLAMELNEGVVTEAVSNNNDTIICFHPLIYRPLKNINPLERVGKLTTELIKSSINLFVIHTNFDAFSEGTSKILADKLSLKVKGFLIPDDKISGFGMGVIAEPEEPINADGLLKRISRTCNSPLKYCNGKTDVIKRIGIVGGSGTSFLTDVNISGLDAFITSDITYHTYHEYSGRLMLIDPGHYEMEQFVPDGLLKVLKTKLKDEKLRFNISRVHTNPAIYYPDNNYTENQRNYLLNNNRLV